MRDLGNREAPKPEKSKNRSLDPEHHSPGAQELPDPDAPPASMTVPKNRRRQRRGTVLAGERWWWYGKRENREQAATNLLGCLTNAVALCGNSANLSAL
jgi:hypothetical protein